MEIIEKILNQYGFGVAVTAFMGIVFWNVLTWMRAQIERTIASAEKREEESRKLWEAHRLALEAHTECSKAFHQEVASAHQYQREEHSRQITALDKIIDKLNLWHAPA
jgi:uncharacterized membrane protein YhiD involved in acid resistance